MHEKKLYIHFPMAVLILEWLIVLYLHYNNPYHFITMSSGTLSILLIGLSSIILGYYFVNSFYLKTDDGLPGDYFKININEVFIGKMILFLSVLALIGLSIMLFEINKATDNFSMYLKNPFLARERIVLMQEGKINTVSFIGYKMGLYLFSLMYPVSVIGGAVSLVNSKWKYAGAIPLILMVLFSLVHLNRTSLITGLGLWIFSRIYFGMYLDPEVRKKSSKKTSIVIILIAMFVIVFFYFIMKVRASSDANLEYYVLKSVYSYLTGSGAAFEKVVFNGVEPLYGASSFRSIFKWLATFQLIDKDLVLGVHNSFVNIGQGFPMRLNTYTFVKSPYEDFGIIGVAVVGLIWGMITRYFIERCFREFSFINIFLVAIMVLSLFMTFFEFFFQGIAMFTYWFFIVIFIERYLKSRGLYEG